MAGFALTEKICSCVCVSDYLYIIMLNYVENLVTIIFDSSLYRKGGRRGAKLDKNCESALCLAYFFAKLIRKK